MSDLYVIPHLRGTVSGFKKKDSFTLIPAGDIKSFSFKTATVSPKIASKSGGSWKKLNDATEFNTNTKNFILDEDISPEVAMWRNRNYTILKNLHAAYSKCFTEKRGDVADRRQFPAFVNFIYEQLQKREYGVSIFIDKFEITQDDIDQFVNVKNMDSSKYRIVTR